MDGIGVKRLNSGIGIDIKDFATNNCFFVLDLTPEQCNNTHLHGESKISFLYFISNLVFTLLFAAMAEIMATLINLGRGGYPVEEDV